MDAVTIVTICFGVGLTVSLCVYRTRQRQTPDPPPERSPTPVDTRIPAVVIDIPPVLHRSKVSPQEQQLSGVHSWTVIQVHDWAKEACSDEIANGLKANGVTGATLANLTNASAQKLLPDIPKGHITGLINAKHELH
ncbi:hypothetical protein HDU84_006780 [Entophlyctis sp. JEL0112]|nr:hypothetical protein HDU84_006780 [Entophlyctis sp. JEL0112]